MKRQTLQIGGALLATTALSTVAHAGSFVTYNAGINPTTLTAISLSTQVFGATNPENVSLGGSTTGGQVNLDFTNALTNAFDVRIVPTGAAFVSSPTVTVAQFLESTGSLSLTATSSATGCSVQVLTDRIEINDCLAGTGSRTDTLVISGLQFNEANGLATAGSSISLSGVVTDDQGTSTFETITSGAVITSADSLETTITAGGTVNLSNTATPAFSTLTNGTTFASLGNVKVSASGATGTNLTTSLAASASLLSSFIEYTVTHGVLTDAATTQLRGTDGGTGTITTVIASSFNGNVASFTLTGDSQIVGSFDITVQFDGTTAIQNWTAGTIDVAFTAGANAASAPASASGALAAIARGGMSVQINTAQSSVGTGATLFQSLVRIVNNGSVAGAATIVVLNDATGAVLGTYTTASIAAGASLQVSVADIEAGASITPAGQYGLSISGAFTGYAQHVMFNSVDNLFVDLSGFRIGSGTNNP